jgi:methyltransferase
MDKNIFEIVEDVLKTREKYVSEDNKLLKAIVYSDVMTMNNELLTLLLSNEQIKDRFFENVNGTLVFDKQKFAWFIESKEFLPDSYTRYTNKIGLTHNGDFISKSNDVVLDFPYKDCVLEGGQDKDDQKRKEIFYNETIASDEITKMLAPKVFTNAKRYTKDGIEENIAFDENDNLIIKGNNLIALSSLLKRYEGKVKCIYIDPPYNTKNDSFNYNDSFNHSSWLTFMKNRLELAKKLMSNDGLIFIQLDYNESHYAKILLDEVLGESNFINEIIWRRKQATSFGKNKFGITNDSIFMYAKSDEYKFYPVYSLEDDNTQKYIKERFVYDDNDGKGKYMKSPLVNSLYRPNLKYVFHGINPPKNGWLYSEEKMNEFYNNGEIIIPEDPNARLYRKIYLSNYKGQVVQNIWIDIPIVNPMAKEQRDFQTQKPESLLKRIIECSTEKGDIVLDYHLGSGTTCAVAKKMDRKFIGVEQMDYLDTVTIERLKDIINGECYGISKSVNWQGGGSFVYCELLENASTLIEKIQVSSEETIYEIKNEIYSDERIVPYITREELNKADAEFENLSFEEKKKSLISLVDKNKLYVNYSDMDDQTFNVTEEDKRFTKSFYEEV